MLAVVRSVGDAEFGQLLTSIGLDQSASTLDIPGDKSHKCVSTS